MDTKDRLKQAFNHARAKGLVSTQKELASLMKSTQASISKAMKGEEMYLTDSFIERFNNTFNNIFDIKWLLNGDGYMLTDNEPKPTNEAVLINNANIKLIPLVGQYAQAGYLCGFADTEYIETLPTIPTIVDHEIKGNYIAFEVRGDSMDDGTKQSLEEGEVLICREVHQDYWRYKLHIHKWNFVIVHKTEGVLVKRIVEHDVENGLITIHSLNPFYPDKVIPLHEVSQLFNVVQTHRKANF